MRLAVILAALCAAAPSAARAHAFEFTQIAVVLETGGGYQMDVAADVDALALGMDPETDSAVVASRIGALSPEEFEAAQQTARQTLRRRVVLRFDGAEADAEISFPQHGTPAARAADPPTVLGTVARYRGRVPVGAESFTVQAGAEFKLVQLRIFDPRLANPQSFALRAGERSPPYPLVQGAARPEASAWSRYVALGFEHILPEGLDHVLFVVGLFLLSTRFRPLLWQVTAFTVAHSVTLALSMLDIVSAPERLVESLIALSIAYVAVENVLTSELKPWRTAVVFGFGLLHGMGFAGVLRELGLPEGEFAAALIGFNVGVELGQLAVVGLAFLAVGRFRSQPWYRRRIAIPVSAAIAAVGLWWAVERAFLE